MLDHKENIHKEIAVIYYSKIHLNKKNNIKMNLITHLSIKSRW